MTALTWRNVDAPNLSPVIQARNNAAQLLSNAFGGLREGITDYQNDPINRSNAILANAIKDQQLAADQYTFGRTQQGNAATDAAAPVLNQAALLNQQGKTQEAAALLKANFDTVGALRPDQVNTAVTTGQNAATGALKYGSDLFDFGSKTAAYQDQQLLDSLRGNILSQANTADGAVAALEANRPNLTPVQYSKAQSMIAQMFPGSYGNTAGTGGATGGTASAGSAISGAVGANAIPVSALFSITRSTESGNQQFDPKTGKPITSSAGATGIMQVMPATGPEAAKLAGVAWDPVKYRNDSAYNQKIGEAYLTKQFNDFGGDPALAWAAYNAGPGALKKAIQSAQESGTPDAWLTKLPKETQDYVAKNVAQLGQQLPDFANTRRTSENAVVDLADRTKSTFGTAADTYLSTINDKATAPDVVGDLKKKPIFANVPQRTLIEKINRIVERGTVNGVRTISEREAGNIIGRNLVPSDDTTSTISLARTGRNIEQMIKAAIPGGETGVDVSSNWAGGIRPNDAAINDQIELYRSGAIKDIAIQQKRGGEAAAQISNYQAQLDQQENLLKDTVARSQSLPGLRSQIPAIEARIQTINSQLRALQKDVPNNRQPAKNATQAVSPSPDQISALLSRFSQ